MFLSIVPYPETNFFNESQLFEFLILPLSPPRKIEVETKVYEM